MRLDEMYLYLTTVYAGKYLFEKQFKSFIFSLAPLKQLHINDWGNFLPALTIFNQLMEKFLILLIISRHLHLVLPYITGLNV